MAPVKTPTVVLIPTTDLKVVVKKYFNFSFQNQIPAFWSVIHYSYFI